MTCTKDSTPGCELASTQQKMIVPNKTHQKHPVRVWVHDHIEIRHTASCSKDVLPPANSRHLSSAYSKYFIVFWSIYKAPQLQHEDEVYGHVLLRFKMRHYSYGITNKPHIKLKQTEQSHGCVRNGVMRERLTGIANLNLLHFEVFRECKTGVAVGFWERAWSIQPYIKIRMYQKPVFH